MRIRASKLGPLSASSFDTPTSSNSPSVNTSSSRCEGLDLLVLAIIEVLGDGALESEASGSNGVGEEEEREKENQIEKRKEDNGSKDEVGLKSKRGRRHMAMPSRFQDSVLQPWKRRTRRRATAAKRLG